MKQMTLGLAVAVATALTAGVSAQTVESKTESKIAVKDGKDVTVTGCLEPTASGSPGYMLTDVRGDHDSKDAAQTYMLVGHSDELNAHVGHLVEIKGKATDKDGKVEVKSKTTVDRENAKDTATETKSVAKGDLTGMPFIGVKSVKMIRNTCS
jgi:hypothetical protein